MRKKQKVMSYIRTRDGILDIDNTKECIYVIRDTSIKKSEFRYVSYLWDNWKNYYLTDYQNCVLFSYNSAQNFISDLMKESLKYQNLVIELSPYYDDCKQADNLAELCDEFVYCYRNDMPILVNEEQIKQIILVGRIQDVRGAIWTDKGLIYVAKMNEKGELELI